MCIRDSHSTDSVDYPDMAVPACDAVVSGECSKAQSLMEQLRRSFNFTVTHLGPHGLPPVSYTHLDVYKRQAIATIM